MSETKRVFRPVAGIEEKILSVAPVNGYVYFATDSRKIYLGENNEFIPMSSSKGYYYGKKDIVYDDSGNEQEAEEIFSLSNEEIEGDRLPEIDDLILNTDGCFYRVISIQDEDSVLATRLTLQGTGGGTGSGGTGGGTGGTTASNFKIFSSGGTKVFPAEAKTATLTFQASDTLDGTNYIELIECAWDKDFSDIFKTMDNLTYLLSSERKTFEIDITNQLTKFNTISNKEVYIRVTDKYGVQRSNKASPYKVKLANLQLTTTVADLFSVATDNFDYVCRIGGGAGFDSRELVYVLYNEQGIEVFKETKELTSSETSSTKTINLSSVEHGTYILEVQLVGVISGATVESNILTHKILRYRESVAQPIFAAVISEEIQQYAVTTFSFLVAYGNTSKQYAMEIKVDSKVETTQLITNNVVGIYNFTFDKQGAYTLEFAIKDLGITHTEIITVSKYTGVLPVIDTDRDDLKVYLTAKGKTNNATDKETWANYRNDTQVGELKDFYFRTINGWMKDEDDVDYLKLSQGAKFEFNAYSPFTDPASTGYTVELDFKIKGVLDYDADLISCVSHYADGSIKTGFTISGDKFKYYVNGTQIDEDTGETTCFSTFNLVEDKRMRISFVIEKADKIENSNLPLCYTYLNGLVSGLQAYKPGAEDGFANFSSDPAYLKVDSTAGEVDLYNVRFYNAALPASMILSNYQATLPSLTERQESYTENLITDSLTEDIDLALIENQNAEGILQIPYVKITGGYAAGEDFSMAEYTSNSTAALPTQKKDYRAIDIEVHYPKGNDYFKDYKDFTMKSTYEDTDLDVTNAFGKIAITGAIMYAQGTSSLEYPVKNLRVKLKGDKIHVRPDISPVNLICFKADYMESAGSNNTGGANYIDSTYNAIGIQTPGQREFTDETIVTCIKGHPCIIFWSQTGEEGSYKFIGKYNLNLDKATPEVFGFKYNEDNGFGYHEDGDTYFDENGETQTAKASDKINSIFCYEFLDNGVAQCNFISDSEAKGSTEVEKYKDSWYGSRINSSGDAVPGWCCGFESRYPEDKEGLHDADALFPLASWINELWDLRVNQGKEAEALERFKNEYEEHFDKDFLLAYYLITEMLLMIDSRVKNMMIATWGKKKWDSTTKSYIKTKNYIWYPIFYDMDTMLGLDNVGKPNKYWYDEDISEKGDQVYNGQCILWNFVRDALSDELTKMFSKFESEGIHPFTADTILPFFNENQSNVANEMIYNEDAEYKYTRPYRTGWTNDKTGDAIAAGTANYLYAEQGNRSMEREYFVNNRVKYLRGKRQSNNFLNADRIKFRITNFEVQDDKNDLTSQMEKIQASIAEVPSSGKYTIKAFKPGYIGVKMGANVSAVVKKYTNDIDTNEFEIDSSLATGTECQLLGMSNVSDLGDLSDKYLYNFIAEINAGDNRLKKLKLGNHAQHYYNPMWKNDDELSLAGYNYLEDFDMENCSTYTKALSFADCPQIKRIILTGSGCSTLVLPANGVLEELRIPTSIRSINIDSHSSLTTDGFTVGYFDYNTDQYVNDFTYLDTLNINNVPLVDTYTMAKVALKHNLDKYSLQGVEWKITEADDLEVVDGKIVGIKVLDGLLNKAPVSGITREESLTGTLIVDNTNSGNYVIDEFEMYQKYHKVFPDLEITYLSSNLRKASFIKFYSTETISGDPSYTVLTNGTQNLEFLTSIEGPNGIMLAEPLKPQTNDTVYTFSGSWKVAETETNSGVQLNDIIKQEDFANYTLTGATSFVAIYDSAPRLYSVTLYDDDGSVITATTTGSSYTLPAKLQWNQDIGNTLSAFGQLNYNYKPYDSEEMQYYFVGWRSYADYAANATEPTWESLNGKTVTGDFVAYATYKLKPITTPFDTKYFSLNKGTKTVSLLAMYRPLITGTIVIPSPKDFGLSDSEAVGYKVGNFTSPNTATEISKITQVLFAANAEGCYEAIEPNDTTMGSFQMALNLEKVVLPKSITKLGKSAFNMAAYANKAKLSSINLENITYFSDQCFQYCVDLELSELNENTTYIGDAAFRYCQKINIKKLPKKIIAIKGSAFVNCSSLEIDTFGDLETDNQLTIGASAFASCNTNISKIYFKSGLKTVAASAFNNYTSARPVTIVHTKDPSTGYGATIQDIFNLTVSDNGLILNQE